MGGQMLNWLLRKEAGLIQLIRDKVDWRNLANTEMIAGSHKRYKF
jgi:hypothetical protein